MCNIRQKGQRVQKSLFLGTEKKDMDMIKFEQKKRNLPLHMNEFTNLARVVQFTHN